MLLVLSYLVFSSIWMLCVEFLFLRAFGGDKKSLLLVPYKWFKKREISYANEIFKAEFFYRCFVDAGVFNDVPGSTSRAESDKA